MQIKDTRNKSLAEYSIQDVAVQYTQGSEARQAGWAASYKTKEDGSRLRVIQPCIVVKLKPEASERFRFHNRTQEVRKHGVEEVVIDCDELETMVGALRKELTYCWHVLQENKLVDKVDALKQKW